MASAKEVAAGSAVQVWNVIKEIAGRVPGLPDALGYLGGVQAFKQVALRVVILREEEGAPLAEAAQVQPSIDEATRVFWEAARVRVVPAGAPVVTVPEPSPAAALDVHCDDGAWQEDFGPAGAYFRRFCARTRRGTVAGYGPPVTVFIVRDISNKGGCSLGPLTDYVTLEAKMLDRARHRLLAHEVGHACGLWHSDDKANLMFPKGPGAELARWQAAILRNSRHVTYL